MTPSNNRRIKAWIGIALLVILFFLTVVFLISGNIPLAVTMMAFNGLVLFILYFSMRFSRNTEDDNNDTDKQ